jgi:hypothetical protein
MGKPFWGRAAVMGVPSYSGMFLNQYALNLTETPIPLVRSGFSNMFTADQAIGEVQHLWYGDESGLQVILFDGEWSDKWTEYDFLEFYPMLKYPSLFITNLESETTHEDGTIITNGTVRSINVTEGAAWDGLFIKHGELPEALQNRGRI